MPTFSMNRKSSWLRSCHSVQRFVDHGGFEMAERAGGDLLHRSLASGQPQRRHFRSQDRRPVRPRDSSGAAASGSFREKRSCPSRDWKPGSPPRLRRPGTDRAAREPQRHSVSEHSCELQPSRGSGFIHCISSAVTSSSLPCTISDVGVPHSEQQNHCTELRVRCAWQLGQKTTTGTSSKIRREPCSGVSAQAIS